MKVAAYCRVSTDKDDQANSFESQQRYFREYIERQPEWDLYDIYADEGISGTSTKKRGAFNRMINDARLGRLELIITKEISRFARNTLDSIQYIRELKKMGVGVLFMNDDMNTLNESSEFLLTLKASMAQEESRNTSQRVKWGQSRRMEQGVVFGRSMLGYDVKDGKMSVNPEGAEIVKLIFAKYVYERKGTVTIAKELREAGYKTLSGKVQWRNTVIVKILHNEKYCGDLLQKKTITPDYLSHQKKYNHGEEEFVFLKDHHQPIVDRELWVAAQREIERRDLDGKHGTGHGNRYPLSGKIKCGICGESFVSRGRRRKDGSKYKCWRCGRATNEGVKHTDPAGNEVGCDLGYQIRDEVGMDIIKQAVGTLQMDTNAVITNVTRIVTDAIGSTRDSNQINAFKLKKELTQIEEKKKNILDAFFARNISKEDMKMMNGEYDRQIAELTDRIRAAENKKSLSYDTAELKKKIRQKAEAIVSGNTATEHFYGNLIDHITACPDRRLEVHLKLLPTKWTYVLDSLATSKNTSSQQPFKERNLNYTPKGV